MRATVYLRWRIVQEGMRTMQDGTKWSLVIFVLISSINMLGLAVDEILERQGIPTITDYVRQHPLWAVPILLMQMIATLALAFHFWGVKS